MSKTNAARLRAYLQDKNLTQATFAEKVGKRQPWVSHVLRGATIPTPEFARLIARCTRGAVPADGWHADRVARREVSR